MRIQSVVLIISAALGPIAFAQTTPTPDATAPTARTPLAFEVASIHPHQGPLHTIMGYTASGPRLRLEGDNLRYLVMEAYGLKYYQVNLPESIAHSDVFYDVVANAPDGTSPTRDDFRHMLQTLLADRFQLKAHFEKKERPVYALVLGKGGPKLQPSTDEKHGLHGVNGRNQFIEMDKITMPRLADDLNDFGPDRPVIDRTGLTGTYKLRVEATPEFRISRDPQAGDLSIFTAVQEQLGLKLSPSTAPLDILVIDSAQPPTPN
jgi:uncharacterized protein (TIGR03435 family)